MHICLSCLFIFALKHKGNGSHFIQEGNDHCESEGSPDSEDSPRAAKHDGQL